MTDKSDKFFSGAKFPVDFNGLCATPALFIQIAISTFLTNMAISLSSEKCGFTAPLLGLEDAMQFGQTSKSRFPHIKGLVTKRTKFGQRYILTIKDENGRDHSITVRVSEGDSVETFRQRVEDARAELKSRINNKTLDEYLSEYLSQKRFAYKTIKQYKQALTGFTLNNERNRKAAQDILTSDRKQGTIYSYLRSVSLFFDWLSKLLPAIKNPTDGIIPKNKITPRSRTMTDDEMRKLLKYLSKSAPLFRLFGLLLIHTGARISTVFALHKSDLTPNGLMMYNVKCKKFYDYAIPVKSREILELWEKVPDEGTIFNGMEERFRHRLNNWLEYNFKRDSRGELLSCHSIRHTFATRAAMNGVPIEVIAKLLDHQSMNTTMKFYARFSPKQIENAVETAIKSFV